MIFGRVVCFFKGHKRGKFVRNDGTIIIGGKVTPGPRIYACPRCGHETSYKTKLSAEYVPEEGSR